MSNIGPRIAASSPTRFAYDATGAYLE